MNQDFERKAGLPFAKAPLLGSNGVLSFDDECVLHFAARYALGRKTASVGIICKVLKREWARLRPGTSEQLQREIREAIAEHRAGAGCDVQEWREILMLPNDTLCREAGQKDA